MWPLFAAGSLLDLTGSYFGSRGESSRAKQRADEDYRKQKEFAQSGISWRVADARRAGINPLAALGVSPMHFQPSKIGGQDRTGQAVSRMGQNIIQLDAEGKKLSNDLTQAIINKTKAETAMIGQPNTDDMGLTTSANNLVNIQKPQLTVKKQPGLEAGTPALSRHYERPDKKIVMALSEAATEPMESDVFAQSQNIMHRLTIELQWRSKLHFGHPALLNEIRNYRPKENAGKGKEWRFNIWKSVWQRGLKQNRVLIDSEHLTYHKNRLRWANKQWKKARIKSNLKKYRNKLKRR